ncbi:hypothetical protein MACH09_45140 [Vibrio sp. MACH09]|uniref:hypothetical protein n=1 Tax=Vibrio sp. MACH09 TaxID=3025122 RepID=UPI00278F1F0F|nr:hypothetical protein [Vibrio sp. MACH09]GLO64006.1 hypothetical protein MACH09_45140 [Vibrio sp. MACH09]
MFLGIFSGIEVLFYVLGALSVIGGYGIYRFWRFYQAKVSSLVLLALGLGTILFAIAWSVSSVLEGEPQAGSMGIVVILLPGLVLSALGFRLGTHSAKPSVVNQ